jgi:hypothetical protein
VSVEGGARVLCAQLTSLAQVATCVTDTWACEARQQCGARAVYATYYDACPNGKILMSHKHDNVKQAGDALSLLASPPFR